MDIIYFENYKEHLDSTINPSLLWEYDLSHFNYNQMRNIVVQRVVERGWRNDWYAALNIYGITGMRNSIKQLPYLNDKDMHFVSIIFKIPLPEMKCYEKKQLNQAHWIS
ncbi:MAG TPA: hypothetical protein VMU83_23710 [Hanamia sp.]|nr:hypothetical protein [Hanamia sp.]